MKRVNAKPLYITPLTHSKLYNKYIDYSCKTQDKSSSSFSETAILKSQIPFQVPRTSLAVRFRFEGSRLGFACFQIMMVSPWRCLGVDEYETMTHWPYGNELHKQEPRASLPAFCLLLFLGLSTCLCQLCNTVRDRQRNAVGCAHNPKEMWETKPYLPL